MMANLTPEGLRELAMETALFCGHRSVSYSPDLGHMKIEMAACDKCVFDAFTALVAEARREQRERDAGVALLFMFKTDGLYHGQVYAGIAPEIAAAIRAQEETP